MAQRRAPPIRSDERRRVQRRTRERRKESPQAAARRPTEQREHVRHQKALAVRIFRRHEGRQDVAFRAAVDTHDISAGGVFLRSTFFLKRGLEVELEIDLDETERTVRVRGVVARVMDAGEGPTGFAIQFLEFEGESEIYLRAYLTRGDVFSFVDDQARALFPRLTRADRGRLVELIVRWEMYQEGLPLG